MLNSTLILYIATVLVFVSGYMILVSSDWRKGIWAMSAQYLAILFLVASVWPLELAVIKLVAGWMAVAVLASTQIQKQEITLLAGWAMGGVFRFIAGVIILIFVISAVPAVARWFPNIPVVIITSGVWLVSMGLMKLGFSNHSSWVVLSLLMVLSGFEVLYAAVETSAMVAGLLAGITLGMGLLGAYLYVATGMSEP